MRNEFWKKRHRQREVEFDVLERIKEMFSYNDDELGCLLKVSAKQVGNYRRSGAAPADRVIAMMQALELMIEDEARAKRQQLKNIFLSCN